MKLSTKSTPISISSRSLKLLDKSEEIYNKNAAESDSIGFMARGLVLATMPHSKPDKNEFVRQNGDYILTMIAPSKVGLPYGSIPRILMAWITREAVMKKSRTIYLGKNLSSFLKKIGYGRTGGVRGDITRVRDQMNRLFSASISCRRNTTKKDELNMIVIIDDADLWWNPRSCGENFSKNSSITLSSKFFTEITESPVPVDIRALAALKKSPLDLDLYVWLTYRLARLRKAGAPICWESLAQQFGSSYGRTKDFRDAFLSSMRRVLTVYPEASQAVLQSRDGLRLVPGKAKPHVAKKCAETVASS